MKHIPSRRVSVNDLRIGYTRRGNTQAGVTLGNTASSRDGHSEHPDQRCVQQRAAAVYLHRLYAAGADGQHLRALPDRGRRAERHGRLDEGRALVQGGHRRAPLRAEHHCAAQSDRVVRLHHDGHQHHDRPRATAVSTGGNALASFLLGQVDTFSIDLQSRTIRPRDYIYEFFAQDDWRALPNLVINAGVRYSLHRPSTETHNQGAVFNLATQQLDYLGVNGYSRSARELHYGNFAPRFGLAYSVNQKTVIRSGFGIVFIDQSGITTPFTTPQFPFIQTVQQKTSNSYAAPFALSNGPTVTPIATTPNAGLGQSVYTVNRKAGSGYVEQWNLAVQRAVTNNLSFDIAYVGSHVVHVGIPDSNFNSLTPQQLAQGSSLTQTVPNPYLSQLAGTPLGTATLSNAQLLKPYPRFQNISYYRNNTGQTNYNAIEAKVEQRLSHNVSLLFAYTHSKLIDDASSVFSSTVLSSPNTSSLVGADAYRPYLERDSSNGDMPNVLTVSSVYALPKFAGHGLFTAALGGWQVQGIITLQSGMPVTVTQVHQHQQLRRHLDASGRRWSQVRPQSLPPELRTPAHFFNTAAFRHHAAVSIRQRIAQPGARTRLSRRRPIVYQEHGTQRKDQPGVSRGAVQPDEHSRLRPAKRSLRHGGLRQLSPQPSPTRASRSSRCV